MTIGPSNPRVAIHALELAIGALRDPNLTTMDVDEAKAQIEVALASMADLRAVLVEQGHDRWDGSE